ncbi:hypothetical protein WH47_00063 [Habropoda laboriosa]|uniref:Uncharacterized protein n=1 Tax=Habropoda laboriosa TaxID=597456 RepID=A0A0L7RKM9_9HYME|nr:hypothetical protein WH47_00061 [Habropoda laboriosa]KOC71306.1 hypothetical protein WH47_00063 [Habropoda laboriosa]
MFSSLLSITFCNRDRTSVTSDQSCESARKEFTSTPNNNFPNSPGNTFSGIQGGQGVMNNHQNTYEVHENVEEDTNYQWHGITAGFGTYSGSRPTNTQITIQNKIAPKDESPYKYHYDRTRLQQKIRPNVADKLGYEEDPPIQNKIAPRSGRISFQD